MGSSSRDEAMWQWATPRQVGEDLLPAVGELNAVDAVFLVAGARDISAASPRCSADGRSVVRRLTPHRSSRPSIERLPGVVP